MFFVGLAHIAFLPSFEGVDETAHWSYVEELASTGHSPVYGRDHLAGDLAAYGGPSRYGDAPPYERTGRATYRSYRLSGAPPIAGGPGRYAQGVELNWQAQHPPLYYALLAPVWLATKGMGWKASLFSLRLASWVMAVGGLAVGVAATARLAPSVGRWTPPIMAAWPFFVPQFFPEMARLGNDSLCLLVMGGVWACLLALLPARQGRPWVALGLGALLGAGLLTKAFFQPIGAGVALLLASRLWQTRSRVAALDLALALGAALLIGGGWYLAKWHATGSLIGSDEFIRMNREGGLWSALQDDFSGLQFLRGLWGIVASFLWGGTWSQVTVSPLILAPLILLLALPVLRWAKGLPKGDRVHWAPLALAVPMAAGLGYHVLVWLAGYGAETPGWYFHILAAPLGFAVASGWRASRGMAVLVASAAVIADGLWACQISMFSGCIGPLGADRGYNLGHAACLVDGRTLSRVAFPVTGALSLATGVGLALLATTLVFRAARTAQATDPLGVSTPTSDTDI